MSIKVITLVILFFVIFIFVNFVSSASLSVAEQKKYKQLIEGQGLYTAEDNVEILTARNFKQKLYGQPHAWFVEFYNSWCGFCQRFAPSWKALASDIKKWRNIVAVGAIDCSDEDNSPICREFEIMGYPTLRYFHENYEEGPKKFGSEIKKGEDADALRRNLVEHMINEQINSRGNDWPSLTLPSYEKDNILDVFDGLNLKVKYAFVITENTTKSILTPTVILDLHKIPEVVIRSVTKENNAFINKQNIKTFPRLLSVKRNDLSVEYFYNEDVSNRENILKVIKQYLKSQGVVNGTEDENKSNQAMFKGKWIENEVPDIAALLEARERQALRQRVRQMGDVVFQMDLETALRYSLKHEIAITKTIEGEKLDALKKYLNVMIKYFPASRRLKHFLQDLLTEINSYGSLVKGEDIAKLLRPFDTDGEAEGARLFSSAQQWLGCSGSSSKYRGYPCGVWQMFHYFTVNAAEQNAGKPNTDPKEVLEAMLGYIKHFFGCADCSQHFQDMAKKNDMQSVSELHSSVIWLWIAHNEVNKRLAGDSSEDPEHPKIQFPSVQNCPKCYVSQKSEKWNLTEVLQYLRHMYSNINVRYLGSDTKVLHDGLASGSSRTKRSSAGTWIIINRMDVSMCFILYVICFGLLVLIVRQFLRKGYKKKLYVHDLLGKV